MQIGQSKLNNHQLLQTLKFLLATIGKFILLEDIATETGFREVLQKTKPIKNIYRIVSKWLPSSNWNSNSRHFFSTGIKGDWKGWNIDLSNTFGQNSFDYTIKTQKYSLRFASPNEFDAGGLRFTQNTINLDFNKDYDILSGLNVAFGGEHRYENFKISGRRSFIYRL